MVVVVVAFILGCCTILFFFALYSLFFHLFTTCVLFFILFFCSCRFFDVFLSIAFFSSSFLAHYSSSFFHFDGFCAWFPLVFVLEVKENTLLWSSLYGEFIFILTNFDIQVSAIHSKTLAANQVWFDFIVIRRAFFFLS